MFVRLAIGLLLVGCKPDTKCIMLLSVRMAFHQQRSLASLVVSAEDLAGVSEIAELLGVSRPTAARYVERVDFPGPAGELARGRVWLRPAVQAWAESRLPLQPGS